MRAHGSGVGRSARGKERIDKRAEGTNRVIAWTASLAYDKYLNGPQLPQADGQIEIAEHSPNRSSEIVRQLLVSQSGHRKRAHLGQEDLAAAVNHQLPVKINLSPDPDQNLISRPDLVIVGYWNLVQRRESCWHVVKQLVSINWQPAAD